MEFIKIFVFIISNIIIHVIIIVLEFYYIFEENIKLLVYSIIFYAPARSENYFTGKIIKKGYHNPRTNYYIPLYTIIMVYTSLYNKLFLDYENGKLSPQPNSTVQLFYFIV